MTLNRRSNCRSVLPTSAMLQFRQFAARTLKGEKPVDLPVEKVTKLELVINLKTAKALELVMPPTLAVGP
jgi:ABC-type uncharacterized transport system substrate-binding protein